MGSTAVRTVALRMEIQGDDVVVRRIDQMGKGGEAAMGRLKNSVKDVPVHLRAIDAASSEVQSELAGLGGRAGIAGTALMQMGPVGLGVAATLGTVAIAADKAFSKTGDVMKYADALERLSKRRDMDAESIQAWNAAARKSDVSEEDLASGLATVKQNVDEYVAGLVRKREARPFKLLGLSREDLALAKNGETQLLMIAGALEKVDVNARRGIIGKLGLEALGPLLELGRAKLEEMLEEARKSGQVLSKNIQEPLAEANKQAEELSHKISNDWARALQGLAPVMNWFQRRWADIAGTVADTLNPTDAQKRARLESELAITNRFISTKGANVVDFDPQSVAERYQRALKYRDRLQAELAKMDAERTSKTMRPIGDAIAGTALQPPLPPSAEDEQEAERAKEAAKRRREELQRLADERTAFINRMTQVERASESDLINAQNRAQVDKLRGKAGYYQAVAKMIRDSADAEIREIDAAAEAELDQLDKLERKFRAAGQQVPADLEAQRNAIENIRRTKTDAVRAQQGQEAQDNAREARGELGQLIDQLNGPVDEAFNSAAAGGLRNFEDALVAIGTRTRDAGEAFTAMATSIIADLERIAVRQYVTKPLANWMFGSGQNSDSASSASFFSGFASFFGDTGSGKAAGGPVSAGVMYPVNERGIETFWAGRDGYVLNHDSSIGAIAAAVSQRIGSAGSITAVPARVEVHTHGEPMQVESQSYDRATNTMRVDLSRELAPVVAAAVGSGEVDGAMSKRFGARAKVKVRM